MISAPIAPNQDCLDDWLAWQESLHVSDIELGLDRCRRVAEALGLGRIANRVVTIAGTNGKGSSVAMLESIMRGAGYRTGTYTSPHLVHYNERIKIDGVALDDTLICATFARIESVRGDTPLTYFEYGTLAALCIFADAPLDIVILEVGLGGRLDAVNIIDADVALIATIGIDHIEFLGDTRDAIALEKAGIMRAHTPAVCSDIDLPKSIRSHAQAIDTSLDVIGENFRYSDDGDSWSWWCGERHLVGLPKPSLKGSYQLINAAGVLRVVDLLQDSLPVSPETIASGLASTQLAGRFQTLDGKIETIVDVAHNAQAASVFVQAVLALPAANKTHVILGMLRVKDRQGVIRELSAIADTWHLASVVARRGASSEELQQSLREQLGKGPIVSMYSSVADAYDAVAAAAEPGDRIVALGSFLVVGEIMQQRDKSVVERYG